MKYNEFIDLVREELEELFKNEASVTVHNITKSNRDREVGISILPKGESISPVIYLYPMYLRFLQGTCMVDILEEIIHQYHSRKKMEYPVKELRDWSIVREWVGARLVSAVENDEYLETVPHRKFLDLALVYFILLPNPQEEISLGAINYNHLEIWGITEEELYCQSQANLPGMMPPCVMNLEDMLGELLSSHGAAPWNSSEADDQGPDSKTGRGTKDSCNILLPEYGAGEYREPSDTLYVVTNRQRYHGAIAMFYPEVMSRTMELLGWEDCYVIPSSVHEFLLYPAACGMEDDHLLQMVREVNDSSVEKGDRLSYSVYYYSAKEQVLHAVPRVMHGKAESRALPIYGLYVS